MNPCSGNQKIDGLTVMEVVIVVVILAILAAVFLPALSKPRRHPSRIECVSNLRMISVAFQEWGQDHGDKFPMHISVTNGGEMETSLTGDVPACFKVMSNTLDNPAILICPNDTKHFPVTNFANLKNSNISYFVGLNASSNSPQSFLSGDDNLIVNGKTIGSGISDIHANDNLAWTKDRHQDRTGNILMADGSVQQTTSDQLTSAARLATNRLMIP